MFNPINLFISRQTVVETNTPAEPEFVCENFTIENFDQISISGLLELLRERTYNFVYENRLTWGATEFNYGDLPISVTLTEDWNVLYTVNRYTTSSPKDAVAIIQDVIQF